MTIDIAPVEIIHLDNGLVLELYDASKKIAGDRWTIVLLARIDVEVSAPEIASALGAKVTYEQKRERVFVDDCDKGTVFGELRASFLANQQKYLAHADFSKRFIQRQLNLRRQTP